MDNLFEDGEIIKMSVVDGVLSIERAGKSEKNSTGNIPVTPVESPSNSDYSTPKDLLSLVKESLLRESHPQDRNPTDSCKFPESEKCPGCGEYHGNKPSLLEDLSVYLRKLEESKNRPRQPVKDSRPENDKVWDNYKTPPFPPVPTLPEDDDDAMTLILQKYSETLDAFYVLTMLSKSVIERNTSHEDILVKECVHMSTKVFEVAKLINSEDFKSSFGRLHRIRQEHGSITAFNRLHSVGNGKYNDEPRRVGETDINLLLSLILGAAN